MFGTSIGFSLMFEAMAALLFGSVLYFGTQKIVATKSGKAYLKTSVVFHPNTISIVRIPLAVLSFVLYFYGYFFAALMLYTLSVVSDGVDGIIARGCSLETQIGKWLDPLSDKLVYFIPLVYFAYFGHIPLLGVFLFIVIDTLGQFSRVLLDALHMETKANIFGKVKTVFVFVWIFTLMLFERLFEKSTDTLNTYAISIAILGAILSIVFKFVRLPIIKK